MTDFLDGVRMGSFDAEYDDDTIEMVLSESAMHLLAHAAAQAESSIAIVSPAVKDTEAEQPYAQAYPGVAALGVTGAEGAVREEAVAEAQSTERVQPIAKAPAAAKVQPVAEAQAAAKLQAVVKADAIAKAHPIGEIPAIPKPQPIAKAFVPPEAQTPADAPAGVARQHPIAKDQVPPGYRPPMSTLRFALILSLVAVASALLTAGTYFFATRASPPVKAVTIRVPAAPAPAPAVAAIPSPPATTAPPSPLPAAAATATVAAAPAPAPSTDAPATVRFVNPFDKKEVFEFPPGTSQADARDAVAELLAERARDRRGELSKAPRRNGKTADSSAPVIASGLSPRS
jgi:hypothetical protein